MDYKQTEILWSVSNVSFAAVRFGETDQFMAVVAIAKDGNKWIISPNQPRMTMRKLQKAVSEVVEKAVTMATREYAPEYMAEVLAYVRNLPDGHRSNYLASVDKELHDEAVTDINKALEHALTHVDSFRAAVEFESRVPYLIGDRELVVTMEDILPDFRRRYNQEDWIISACEAVEEKLRRENSFTNTQISEWKKAEGLSINSLQN